MPKPDFSRTDKPKRREPMTAADVAFNKRMSADVQQEWLERCLSSSKLTSWEQDFLESIEDQLGAGRTLSERQVEVLERIYNKI